MCADDPNRPAPIVSAPVVEADEGLDDRSETSSIHTSSSSSTSSLTESVQEYREIHGRTYTQRTDYWGPNDERASESLELSHFWITDFLDGKLFLAPIGDNPQRVLDMGTGNGIWAIDMADTYPSAEITGVDLSPIQPSWVPANCKFVIDDFEQEWTWPLNHFDYVHARSLEACFADLRGTMKEVFEHTKPGGWIEILEFETEMQSQSQELPDDHVYKRWNRAMVLAADRMGKPTHNVGRGRTTAALDEAGYVDLVHQRFKIPLGAWPADPKLRRIGRCTHEWVDEGLENFGLYVFKEFAGMSYAECQVMFAEYRAAMKDPKLQSFYWMHILYARKPEASEEETAPAATE